MRAVEILPPPALLAFTCCLRPVALNTQALKVRIVVCSSLRLRDDMVNVACFNDQPAGQVLAAQPSVTLHDTSPTFIPGCAISTLVAVLPGFILLPALAAVFLAVAASVGCRIATSPLAAGFWCSRRHKWGSSQVEPPTVAGSHESKRYGHQVAMYHHRPSAFR